MSLYNRLQAAVLVGSVALVPALPVNAAVDAAVTTALDGAKADGLVVAGAVLVVIIAIAAFKFIRRAL